MAKKDKKVLLLYSGGLDSEVLRKWLNKRYTYVGLLYIDSDTRAAQVELNLFNRVEAPFKSVFKGSQLVNKTLRNLIYAGYGANVAAQNNFDCFAMGLHDVPKEDNFPDSEKPFVKALTRAVKEGSAGKVQLLTPLMKYNKTGVVKLGQKLKVNFENTYSCYEGREGIHCGKCYACLDRKKAFREAGVEDNTPYEVEE